MHKRAGEKTRPRIIRWLEDHCVTSVVVFLALLIAGLADFAENVSRLRAVFSCPETLEMTSLRINASAVDVLVRNPTASTAVVFAAELQVIDILEERWEEPEGIGGYVGLGFAYTALLSRSTGTAQVPIAQQIKAGEADRFMLLFTLGQPEVRRDKEGREEQLEYVRVKAQLRLRYNDDQESISDPFELSVPSLEAHYGSYLAASPPPVGLEDSIQRLMSDDFAEVRDALLVLRTLRLEKRLVEPLHRLIQRDWEVLRASAPPPRILMMILSSSCGFLRKSLLPNSRIEKVPHGSRGRSSSQTRS